MSEIYRNLKKDERRIERDGAKEGNVKTRHVVIMEQKGRYTIDTPLMFGVAYVEKPDMRTLTESDQWDEDGYPNVQVGVREWIRDESGHYVGALVWAVVS